MPRVRLTPPPGLNSDDTTYAAKGAWADADWVRFRDGKAQSVGGFESVIQDALGGVCRAVLPWADDAALTNIAFGHHAGLQVYVDGSLYDITPAGFVRGTVDSLGGAGYGTGAYGVGSYGLPSTAQYYALTWSLSVLGQGLIANPRGRGIYRWKNDTTAKAALIPNAPTQVTYALVTPQGQVMALGCNEESSGVFNAMLIRTSDLDDGLGSTGSDPIEVWNTATSNLAREYTQIKRGSRIVGAEVMGEYVVVLTDAALYLGTFTGDGTTPWTWALVATECGLVGPNAKVVPAGTQQLFWRCTDGQWRVYGLGGEPATLPCPIRDDLNTHISAAQQDKIVLASVSEFDEVWTFYPDSRDGLENSRAVLVNRLNGQWSRVRNPLYARSAFCDGGPVGFPIGVSPAGHAYYHDKANSADGAVLPALVETADQGFDDDRTRMRVNTIYPDFSEQQGPVSVTLITRENPQAPEVERGPFVFSPGQSKMDVRGVEGRMIRARVEQNSSPSFFRLGAMTFDVQPAGTR